MGFLRPYGPFWTHTQYAKDPLDKELGYPTISPDTHTIRAMNDVHLMCAIAGRRETVSLG